MNHSLVKNLVFVFGFILFLSLTSYVKANEPTNKLYVSPTSQVVEYSSDQQSVTKQISITNGYDHNLTVEIQPILLKLDGEHLSVLNDQVELLSKINIASKVINIKSGEKVTVEVQLSDLSEFQNNIYPGVNVIPKEATSNEANLILKSSIISTFILERSEGKVIADLHIELIKNNIFSKNFTVKGYITNNGERIFSPTGSIRILKGNTKVKEIEITTLINKELLPNQTIYFEKNITIDEKDSFKLLGKYNVETNVTPQPYTDSLVKNSQTVYIIPFILTGLIIVISILLVVLVVYSIIFFRKNKKKK